MKVIDKREKNIEVIRNKNLEAYYLNTIELNPDILMNLGLNMYIKNKKYFKQEIYNVFNASLINENIILHPQQVEVLNILLSGENILLSAPTSFGKTFVALEYIGRTDFKNIVFVIPTLALMNELSVKIRKSFGKRYNIITNSFEFVETRNIFILVPERIDIQLLNEIRNLEIDLLIFDEIYKLKRIDQNNNRNKDKRLVALNKGYFDMVQKAKQIILLGPFIKDIQFSRTELNKNIVKYFSDYAPVFIRTRYIEVSKDEFVQKEVLKNNNKLIYFDSPNSIYEFCSKSRLTTNIVLENSLTSWCDKYLSTDWLPSLMLKQGIGIHHGNIPGFMRRYIEYLYNNSKVNNLLCTSTLLEGINTPTDELIIYDSDKLTAFQTNNLIGRVGRLDTFKAGKIYFFDKKLEKYIIGEEKYETIEIVAETEKIDELEELLYLQKSMSELTIEQQKKIKELNEKLSFFNKNINDLKSTDGFLVDSLIKLIDNLNKLEQLVKQLRKATTSEDPNEKKKATTIRKNIIQLFMDIIPDKSSMVNQINKGSTNKINKAVCINALLVLNPSDIYAKINRQINNNKKRLSKRNLNMFVDYLFHLAFGYIKYELSKIVKYFNFLFDENYIGSLSEDQKDLINILNKEILRRFEIFNCEDNKIIKILLDIGIPYTDCKKIEKIIKKEIKEENISTGKIYDFIEMNKERIKKETTIDEVTKDLLDMIV